MRILVVSWSVPPDISGSSVVIENLAMQFTGSNMRIVGESTDGNSHLCNDKLPEIVYVGNKRFADVLGRRFIIPIFEIIEFPSLVTRVIVQAFKFKASHIVAVFPDARYLAAGYIAALVTGVGFFPYYHNTYVENRSGLSKIIAICLQFLVFKLARRVFVLSKGMQELFLCAYPSLKKVTPLLHSFTGPLPIRTPLPRRNRPLRLALIGSINESCLDATQRLRRAVALLPEVELYIHTSTPERVLRKWGLLGDRVVVSQEKVSRARLMENLMERDIMVLPHGLTGGHSNVEYQTIFPTRTIEYLLSQRPILAHTPDETFLTRFLRSHKCALVVTESSEIILAKAIMRLGSDRDLCEQLVSNSIATATMFHAPLIADVLRKGLLLEEP